MKLPTLIQRIFQSTDLILVFMVSRTEPLGWIDSTTPVLLSWFVETLLILLINYNHLFIALKTDTTSTVSIYHLSGPPLGNCTAFP